MARGLGASTGVPRHAAVSQGRRRHAHRRSLPEGAMTAPPRFLSLRLETAITADPDAISDEEHVRIPGACYGPLALWPGA
eukprot:CAMPEP_0176120342 /NCGR_PEP_ID=MMETSP0120_2-20121206/60533_1 /TAXON_ID=160619 /ORGANISM="Kryptoperidinium foliaceum, Strain CCMP 1326" /LENGTH=79 /DNA_ID=CAMNT_0017454799 /DNA_START=57 /DNA_END=294 /DNA_ORIENTATION=+